MRRYIDAYKIPYHDLSDGRGKCEVAFLEDIIKVPTADVVEVVRCKDCIHNYIKSWNQGRCRFTDYRRSNEFYCGFGERAEL